MLRWTQNMQCCYAYEFQYVYPLRIYEQRVVHSFPSFHVIYSDYDLRLVSIVYPPGKMERRVVYIVRIFVDETYECIQIHAFGRVDILDLPLQFRFNGVKYDNFFTHYTTFFCMKR